ncbi:MAG: hypothetical protein M3R67_05625 [Acidobacteriota bacterium]|nr:hypothetical protein [Acidobacteriota bacterium]
MYTLEFPLVLLADESAAASVLRSRTWLDTPEFLLVLLATGDSAAAPDACFAAGLDPPELTLVLHLGQRILKGRDKVLVSSTCNREEHFGQTIVMAILRN